MTEGLPELIARLEDYSRLVALGYTERFEKTAEHFYKATGLLAPGKSVPLALGGYDEGERSRAWATFQAEERVQYQSDLAAAIAALREASRPQEAAPRTLPGGMNPGTPMISARPLGNANNSSSTYPVEASRIASPPAKQETIVDFLRTRAKSHRAIGEADGDIRSDECEALADELEAHPLATSPPATDSLETRFVDTFTQLARNQHALDPADAKVLYDNLWSLYDDSDPHEPNITLAASPSATTETATVNARLHRELSCIQCVNDAWDRLEMALRGKTGDAWEASQSGAITAIFQAVWDASSVNATSLDAIGHSSPPETAPARLTSNDEAQAALTTLSLLMEWPRDTRELRTCQHCFDVLLAAHGSRPAGRPETET